MEIDVNKLVFESLSDEKKEELILALTKKDNKKLTVDEIIDKELENFKYQIKTRGKDYYEKGNITSLTKANNTFIAKVNGTATYDVVIEFNLEDESVYYDCDCPYEYECKHIYATLLAIKNKEYIEVELKPEIKKNKLTLAELIKAIPAEELKAYLLSKEGKDYVCFEMDHLENAFLKYIPKQTYEYYYNKLYNKLIVKGYNHYLLKEYISSLKGLLNSKEYEESFFIIKAIIEATNDTNHLDKWEDLINNYPILGMNLRIIYRKCDNNIKKNIDEWLNKLEENNYYNSIYLEDIIISVK